MAATVVPVPSQIGPASNVDALRAYYEFDSRHYEPLIEYLASHSELISALLDAYPLIEKYFGYGAHVTLELPYSPDDGFFLPLSASISSAQSVEESIATQDRFCSEWWDKHPYDPNADITFTVRTA